MALQRLSKKYKRMMYRRYTVKQLSELAKAIELRNNEGLNRKTDKDSSTDTKHHEGCSNSDIVVEVL